MPALASQTYVAKLCIVATKSSPQRSKDHCVKSEVTADALLSVPQVSAPQAPDPQP